MRMATRQPAFTPEHAHEAHTFTVANGEPMR
jgi:hypothetical protein